MMKLKKNGKHTKMKDYIVGVSLLTYKKANINNLSLTKTEFLKQKITKKYLTIFKKKYLIYETMSILH